MGIVSDWIKVFNHRTVGTGCFFRFTNLDEKFYWNDEAMNSLRASGYTETELFEQVFNGHVIGIEDLQKY